jgi:hypothetical protein
LSFVCGRSGLGLRNAIPTRFLHNQCWSGIVDAYANNPN